MTRERKGSVRPFRRHAALALAALTLGTAAMAQPQEPVAVVVHPGNPLRSVSFEDLRGLFLGSVAVMSRERVILVESAAVRARFYTVALRMSEDQVKRHWIAAVFSGESSSPPQQIDEPAALLKFVATHPGAIAFLPAKAVDGSVKVLAVQGRLPSDPTYPLR